MIIRFNQGGPRRRTRDRPASRRLQPDSSGAECTVSRVMPVLAIRAQFKQAAYSAAFPDFNNGYYYPVDARLHLLRDPQRWAMVVELVGCNPRAGNLINVIHTFGKSLTSGNPGFGGDGSFLDRIANMNEAEAGLGARQIPTGRTGRRPGRCDPHTSCDPDASGDAAVGTLRPVCTAEFSASALLG